MIIACSSRVLLRLVSVGLTLSLLMFFTASSIFSAEDGFVVLKPGSTPQFGNLRTELIEYLKNNPDFAEGKKQIKIVINSSNPEENNSEYIANLKETIRSIFQEAGVTRKLKTLEHVKYLFRPKTKEIKRNEPIIKVDFVTFPVTNEEKIVELNEAIDERVLDDNSIQEKADLFIEQLQKEKIDLYDLDPGTLQRVVAIYKIVTEEMARISKNEPALFNKANLDSIAASDISALMSQISSQGRTQIIDNLAAALETNPKQVASIFGINDSSLTEGDDSRSIAESIFKSIVTIKYIAITLAQTLRVPIKDLSISEMIQGMIPKSLAIAQSFAWNSYIYGDQPTFFYSAFGMSLILDTFHGVEASGWVDFQNRMNQEKGRDFVTIFNMSYMLLTTLPFRINTFLAGKMPLYGAKEGFLSLTWVGFIYLTSLAGSVIGTEAYAALNRLHFQKFILPKRARDFIQQFIRDSFLIITGLMLGTGGENDPLTYAVFGASVTLDSTLYYLSLILPQRSALLVGNLDTLANPKLGFTYPYLKDHSQVIPEGGTSKMEALKETKALLKRAGASLISPCKTLFGK